MDIELSNLAQTRISSMRRVEGHGGKHAARVIRVLHRRPARGLLECIVSMWFTNAIIVNRLWPGIAVT
jgi:hypothetical protein